MHDPIETVRRVGDRRVHRFQVVRERRNGDRVEDWIVVGLEGETIRLADPDFEWDRTLTVEAFLEGPFEPLAAGGVPVWGY